MTSPQTIELTRATTAAVVDFINRPDEHQRAHHSESNGAGVVTVTVDGATVYLHPDSTITRTDTEYVVVRAGESEPAERFPRLTTPVYLEILRGRALAHQEHAATAATGWTVWADRLQRLIDEMPLLERSLKRLDGDGEVVNHPVGVEHVDTSHLQRTLTGVRATADSVAGAYGRAVRVIGARQSEALHTLAADLGRPDLA